MRPRLTVSRSAVELIKAFEGYRRKSAQLDDGRWTIGYGHTLTAREGAEITEPDAEALLLYDLIQASHAVNEHVFAPLNQNQFDALVSFVFNIGVRAFRGSPTLRRLNEGRPLEAALAMELWRKADLDGERIVIDALVRRRAAEKALFLRPPEGWTPAPTPLLQPKLDYDAMGLVPLNSPVATRAELAGERAFVERAEIAGFQSAESPSASEEAAAAAIERLQAILAEPITPRPAESRGIETPTPNDDANPPPPDEAPMFNASRPRATSPGFVVERQTRRRGPSPWLLALIGLAGVALVTLAAIWSVRPMAIPLHGVSSGMAALFAGGLGLVLAILSGYFLLERLGRPRGGLR
jgi:lysozyme